MISLKFDDKSLKNLVKQIKLPIPFEWKKGSMKMEREKMSLDSEIHWMRSVVDFFL